MISKFNVVLVLVTLFVNTMSVGQHNAQYELGVATEMQNDSVLRAAGFDYLIESTARLLSPRNVTDEQFESLAEKISRSQTTVFACNLFIPGDLKVVGPAVDENAILTYVSVVFKRAQAAGIRMIIWGSGGSRGVPAGFDREKAKGQFVSIARKIGLLAAQHNVVVALENLNSTECNFITTVKEAADIIRAVDHPNIRLCVDIYHMLKEGEPPASILKAKGLVVYCELAEKESRTPPGVNGQDFSPYFEALKKIKYSGKFTIESRWDNLKDQAGNARAELKRQLESVYKN